MNGINSASVDTSAAISGNAWSTTTGTATGNAAGYNYGNSNTSGTVGAEGTASFNTGETAGTVNAGSEVTGSASAGSIVQLGPNAPGVTTSGTSYQEAGFEAYHNSIAEASATVGDDYCEVPSDLSLYVVSSGSTDTYATGTLSGTGAGGGSGAYATEGGYANGEVGIHNDYVDGVLTASVDNNATFSGEPVSSFSYSQNLDGETTSSANSASNAYVDQGATGAAGPCCQPTVDIYVDEYKSAEGTVVEGEGVAGSGVKVDFNSNVNVHVETDPGTIVIDPPPPGNDDNGGGNDDNDNDDNDDHGDNGYGNGSDNNPPWGDHGGGSHAGQDDKDEDGYRSHKRDHKDSGDHKEHRKHRKHRKDS